MQSRATIARGPAHARLVSPWLLAVALLLAPAAGCAQRTAPPPDAAPPPDRLMTARDVQALPRQAPDHRIGYGKDAAPPG